MRHPQRILRAGFMAATLFIPPGHAQSAAPSARHAATTVLMDIDWNQLYYTLISDGLSPAAADAIVMQGQRDAGDPEVGCTSSPENGTLLLALVATTGLLSGFFYRRRVGRPTRVASRATS